MAKGERIEDYKEVTASERTKLETADAAWERPPQLLIDEWNVAFCNGTYGRYNEQTGFFEGNDVFDMTTKQAIAVLRFGMFGEKLNLFRINYGTSSKGQHVRTTVPSVESNQYVSNVIYGSDNTFSNWLSNELETVRYLRDSSYTVLNKDLGFIGPKLRAIFDKICPNANNLTFGFKASEYHELLTTLFIYHLAYNFSLRYLKALSYDTMLYLVENSAATSPITVTVHPDVLAKMNGDTSNDAAAALSPEEAEKWQTLIPLGAEKNITFATT